MELADNDFKWFCLAVMSLIVGCSVVTAVAFHADAVKAQSAMECGYEQVKDGKCLLWKKTAASDVAK